MLIIVYTVLCKLLNLPFCGGRTNSAGKDGSCTVGVTDDWFWVSQIVFCAIVSISGVAVVDSVEYNKISQNINNFKTTRHADSVLKWC